MFEDGIYVSYFTNDTEKAKEPRSTVSIIDGKVTIFVNPKADENDAAYLNKITADLKASASTEEYEKIAIVRLGKFWEWNGYTPNPSDFFEIDSPQGNKALELARTWKTKE